MAMCTILPSQPMLPVQPMTVDMLAMWQVSQQVKIPIIGIGGIQSIDDVMEFLLVGATAVQIGTANFYNPGLANQIIRELPEALATLKAESVKDIVGTLQIPKRD